MTTEIQYLIYSTILGFLIMMAASQAASKVRGMDWAMGNRDVPQPPLPVVPARLQRAFENFQQTFPFFVAAVLAAQTTGHLNGTTATGVQLYFWARLLHPFIYAFGIKYVRTLDWFVSIIGIGMVIAPML